ASAARGTASTIAEARRALRNADFINAVSPGAGSRLDVEHDGAELLLAAHAQAAGSLRRPLKRQTQQLAPADLSRCFDNEAVFAGRELAQGRCVLQVESMLPGRARGTADP